MAYYFLLNRPRRFIAVLSPKCGSQSMIRWFLDTIDGGDQLSAADAWRFQIHPSVFHRYRDFLKFVCVHDPLHRLVSFYVNWVVHDTRLWSFADQDQRFSLRDKTFRQFLFVLDHLQRHDILLQHHLLPQVHLLENIEFDEFILLKDAERGLRRLGERLRVDARLQIRNARSYNKSLTTVATDCSPAQLREHGIPAPEWFYDSETRELAAKVYSADLDFYRFAQTRASREQSKTEASA